MVKFVTCPLRFNCLYFCINLSDDNYCNGFEWFQLARHMTFIPHDFLKLKMLFLKECQNKPISGCSVQHNKTVQYTVQSIRLFSVKVVLFLSITLHEKKHDYICFTLTNLSTHIRRFSPRGFRLQHWIWLLAFIPLHFFFS